MACENICSQKAGEWRGSQEVWGTEPGLSDNPDREEWGGGKLISPL